MASDLVAHWIFSELAGNVVDSSGNGHTAIQSGVVPAQVGKFGSGARGPFSDGNYFKAVDAPDLRVQPPFSVAVWAYYVTLNLTQYAKLFGKEYSDVSVPKGFNASWILNAQPVPPVHVPMMLLEWRSGPLTTDQLAETFLPGVAPTPAWPLTTGWHHIGFSFAANGDLYMYLDGVKSRFIPGIMAGKQIYYDGTELYFGRDGTFGGSSWNGWLDEVSVYNSYKDEAFFNSMWLAGQPPLTSPNIDDVVPIARDLIEVEFSGDIAVTESVLAPANYVLSPGISVAEVLPIDGDVTDSVILRISPKATIDTIYSLTVGTFPETFYTPEQVPLEAMTGSWLQHKTKIDSVLASLPAMYSRAVGANIRTILQAVAISDEEIGGDF